MTAPFAILLAVSAFVLAERGKAPDAVLSVEPKDEVAAFAADELREYVRRMTGVSLAESPATVPRRIAIVRGDAGLGEDGFEITASEGELRIAGGPRGVLYGVYELLERFGGVAWFTSWCEDVPARDRIEVPVKTRIRQLPAFPVREVFWTDALENPVFAARLRSNNRSWHKPVAKTGGNAVRFGGGLVNCHTFGTLMPTNVYFEAHPEYYSEIGGKRIGLWPQLCLSNPEVLAIVTSNVLAAIRRDPTATCYGVSQNDWANNCTCAACRAIDEAEGSPSGSIIRFVNRVADEVAKVAPDKIVETLAYQYSQHPPRTARPRDNVMVCLCSIGCDFSRPLAESRFPADAAFLADLGAWSGMTRRLYVWDYTTNFSHFQLPHPNVKSLQANIRSFRDAKVHYLFEQGVFKGWHGDFAELKAYLLGKWMWDPDLPAEPLLDRFFRGYYGAAAACARECFERLHALPHDEAKNPLKPFTAFGAHASSSNAVFLAESRALWRRAEELVRDDPVRRYNVRTSSLPIDYAVFLRCERDASGAVTRGKAARRILAIMDEAKAAGREIILCESLKRHAETLERLRACAGGEGGTK